VTAQPLPEPPLARPASSTRVSAVVFDGARRTRRSERLATEEPLEIRVEEPDREQRQVAVTMRTPGHDFDLAVGFLFTEGLIGGRDGVRSVRYCAVDREEQRYNVVSVTLTAPLRQELDRNFYATSSCGVCGKATLDAIEAHCAPVPEGPRVAPELIVSLPARLRDAQRVFDRTGGLHAAGLFPAAGGGEALVREDVGRHNAVDKAVGERMLAGALPLSDSVMMVSGRASLEIVQKAAMAGVPVICAVSAPSSLAVAAASRFGITLIGFLRGERFNVYTGVERVDA
jgi:FdhD protein